MKSAREQAAEALSIAADGNLDDEEAVLKIELLFKGHARDQRHICAEAAGSVELYGECHEASAFTRNDAQSAVMNAPAPGETR